MGHHPVSVPWQARDGQEIMRPEDNKIERGFSDEQCAFINKNVGVSRRTLRDVAELFNKAFQLKLSYEEFIGLRADAISNNRCKTTYFRNYFKGENSSERELRKQKFVLKSRITGGCQYQLADDEAACGSATTGRFCEKHVRLGHKRQADTRRGIDYIDSSLGKYG